MSGEVYQYTMLRKEPFETRYCQSKDKHIRSKINLDLDPDFSFDGAP